MSLRLRMMLEEVLLNYQEHFGEDKEFSLHTRRLFGQIRVAVSLIGDSFDPFVLEDDGDQALLSRMTADSHVDFKWSYKDGVNSITIMPEKKRRLSSAAASVLAMGLGVVAGLAWMQTPDAIRTPFLEDYISPVLNTVMGLITAVGGPLIFFSLVWGITAIAQQPQIH